MGDRIHSIKYAVVPSGVRAACPVHVIVPVVRVVRMVRNTAQAAIVTIGLMAVGAVTVRAIGVLGPTVVRAISHVRRVHTGMVHRVVHAPPAIIALVFLVCPKAVCTTDTVAAVVAALTHSRTVVQRCRGIAIIMRQRPVRSSMAVHRQIVTV